MNRLVIEGNVGSDPELRKTAKGESVCNWRIAVNGARGAEWFGVVAWGPLADSAAEKLHKGQRVHIEGAVRLKHDVPKDGKGKEFWSLEVNAEVVRVLKGVGPSSTGVEVEGEENADLAPLGR